METGAGITVPPLGKGGASLSDSTTHVTPGGTRRVVESRRSSKKASDTGEKKGNIFSRWRQKHKLPEKPKPVTTVETSELSAEKVLPVVDKRVKEVVSEKGVDKMTGQL